MRIARPHFRSDYVQRAGNTRPFFAIAHAYERNRFASTFFCRVDSNREPRKSSALGRRLDRNGSIRRSSLRAEPETRCNKENAVIGLGRQTDSLYPLTMVLRKRSDD